MLLIYTFLDTRIQRLFYGMSFAEKELGTHLQCMLEMSSVLSLAEILSKLFGKKSKGNWGPYFRSRFDKLTIC